MFSAFLIQLRVAKNWTLKKVEKVRHGPVIPGFNVAWNETVELRPIEMEIQNFNMVVKLIVAGAYCGGIQYSHLRRNCSAIKLLKLLYHLGIYVDVVEGYPIYDWSQRQPVKTLQELAAMAVRRKCTQK